MFPIILILLGIVLGLVIWVYGLQKTNKVLRQSKKDVAHIAMDDFNAMLVWRNLSTQLQTKIDALEQGSAEIQEGYEQEFLTMGETINVLNKQRNAFAEIARGHQVFCLPDLLDIQFFEGFNQDVHVETPIYESVAMDFAG